MSKTRKFEEIIHCLATLHSHKQVETVKMIIRQNPDMLRWNMRMPYCVYCEKSLSNIKEHTCRACDRHTIPADNSLEYALLCFNTPKKLSGEAADCLLDVIKLFKEHGTTFRSSISGPLRKHGKTTHLYIANGYDDRRSPFNKQSLSSEKRANVEAILAATDDSNHDYGYNKGTTPSSKWPDSVRLGGSGGKRRSSQYTPDSPPPKRKLLVVSSDNGGEYVDVSTKKRRTLDRASSNFTVPQRTRYDSGRDSLQSDELIKPDIKHEDRTPPAFAETVGSRGELTPDEFYAQSLRLDFPRSKLDPEDIFQLWRKTCICHKRKSEWIEKTKKYNESLQKMPMLSFDE